MTVLINFVLIDAGTTILQNFLQTFVLLNYSETVSDASKYFLIIVVVGGAGGAVISVACLWILKIFDKLHVYRFFLVVVSIGSIFLFIYTIVIDDVTGFIAIAATVTLMAVPLNLINSFMVRDLVVYDTFVTRLKRANTYFSAVNLPSNILSTALSSIPLIGLTLTGFKERENPVDDQSVDAVYNYTDEVLWVLRFLGPPIVFLSALYLLWVNRNYKLTSAIADEMLAINDKRSALEVEISAKDARSVLNPLQDRQQSFSTVEVTDEIKPIALDNSDSQTLMHLSTEELALVSRGSLSLVIRWNKYFITISLLLSGIIVGSLALDISLGALI